LKEKRGSTTNDDRLLVPALFFILEAQGVKGQELRTWKTYIRSRDPEGYEEVQSVSANISRRNAVQMSKDGFTAMHFQ